MTYDFYVRNKDDLIEAVQNYGIVPYFSNSIPGFSLEERCDPRALWSNTGDDSWAWKGPVIQATHCAYGKFFEKKAAYVSKEVFLDLANYRRDGYDFDSSLSDFYDRLYKKLRSYGVTDIPKFSELYGLFESLLRPAIDAAIRRRQKTGRQNMAELDADAYARGMGGSSYLSSVKAREQDDIASDVTALEGQYVSSMGDYLYKALSKLQDMEAELRKTQMSIASAERRTRMSIAAADRRAYLAALAKGGAGAGTGADGDGESEPDNRIHAELGYMPYGHNKNGAYFDGQWYDGDFGYLEKDMSYGDYVRYLKKLSASERYLFFSSNDKEWRSKRWQVQYNLPQVDYLDLVEMFMPDYDPFYYGGHSGYDDDLWQNILYD